MSLNFSVIRQIVIEALGDPRILVNLECDLTYNNDVMFGIDGSIFGSYGSRRPSINIKVLMYETLPLYLAEQKIKEALYKHLPAIAPVDLKILFVRGGVFSLPNNSINTGPISPPFDGISSQDILNIFPDTDISILDVVRDHMNAVLYTLLGNMGGDSSSSYPNSATMGMKPVEFSKTLEGDFDEEKKKENVCLYH